MTRVMYAESTGRAMIEVSRAETFLLDYRPPGASVSTAERLKLCELIGAGWKAADAAEHVQALQLAEESTPA